MNQLALSLDHILEPVLAVLPQRRWDLDRLRVLLQLNVPPTVTVVGKYNHGKSRLLNELMGSDVFNVADRRETVALAEHIHEGVRWLDAPGLYADVALQDDALAREAMGLQADIRLFVHAAKEGELDALESNLLQELAADHQRSQRQNLMVISQIDQLADDEQQEKVLGAIQQQCAGLVLHPVSSTRYRQGREGGKPRMLEKSGIPALQASLEAALKRVPQAREFEREALLSELTQELNALQQAQAQSLHSLQQTQQQQHIDFVEGLHKILEGIAKDLEPVVNAPGVDHSLVPDTVEFGFKMTAGKQERARLQIAYSRACIAINGHLVEYGAVGLPAAQRTSVRSMDTVMIAVMGVSVKYRADLRRIFCEQAGRDKLVQGFTHYFEVSDGRVALEKQIEATENQLEQTRQALEGLSTLEHA
ncbi:GTPase [Alcaligenes aquatilis]|uniref:GTPase n=1 Tax=Alcaligenes aquatilis TaxID=323284 RepID=UPI003F8EC8FB